ncbi:hypothetical protein P692DRAFT_20361559 [Suillus brevipes Sb2]|jgi:hypothetical protein|nr:hypothetical protein P692DRAFT_20361559 [Suillus brevipes Sb2]
MCALHFGSQLSAGERIACRTYAYGRHALGLLLVLVLTTRNWGCVLLQVDFLLQASATVLLQKNSSAMIHLIRQIAVCIILELSQGGETRTRD